MITKQFQTLTNNWFFFRYLNRGQIFARVRLAVKRKIMERVGRLVVRCINLREWTALLRVIVAVPLGCIVFGIVGRVVGSQELGDLLRRRG